MTVAKFLEGVAAIFEQPAFRDGYMARQCRDYATIAANLEYAEALRQAQRDGIDGERAARRQFAGRAAERAARAKKT